MGPKSFAAFCAICCIALYASLAVLTRAVLVPVRIDFSAQAGAHLSPGSRAVVAALKEPLALTLYRTRWGLEQRPDIRDRGERVRTLLQAYQASSRGHIVLRERDPIRFSVVEDQALRGGLVPLHESQEDGWSYLGVVASNTLDETLSIPKISAADEMGFERAVTQLILRLDKPEAVAPSVPLRQLAALGRVAESPEVQTLRGDLVEAEAALVDTAGAAVERHAVRDRVLRLRAALRAALRARSAQEARLWTLLVLGHIVILPCALALAGAWAGRRARATARRGG